jgi:hypothetical protein
MPGDARCSPTPAAPILTAMDDFRAQLTAVIDDILAAGKEPMFLVIDLFGAEYIKANRGAQDLENFREAAMNAVTRAAPGSAAFCHGELRVVGILPGYDRLKTFALIDKLGRALPFVAQSYDCVLYPEFDTLEYDPKTGVAGLINHLVQKPRDPLRDSA